MQIFLRLYGPLLLEPSPMPSPYSVTPVMMSPKPRAHIEPPHFSKTILSVVTSEGEEARFEGVVTGKFT